jgi:cellulose synthase/poly-beta-1,6-N-acetylglucosamine synthase-like glycosyltransferase
MDSNRRDTVSVTVIMAAYNAASTIADAIESVLAQTCPAWELIVVDDGSSDATRAIAEGFAGRHERIRLVRRSDAAAEEGSKTAISLRIGRRSQNPRLRLRKPGDHVQPGEPGNCLY